MAGLAVLVALLLWPPLSPVGIAGSLAPAGLLLAGIRPPTRWGGWVAVLMIPYLAAAAMNVLAGPMPRGAALLFAGSTVIAGLGGLDWVRRSGHSLRR